MLRRAWDSINGETNILIWGLACPFPVRMAEVYWTQRQKTAQSFITFSLVVCFCCVCCWQSKFCTQSLPTSWSAQNMPLLTNLHLQQYFTLGIIRFPPQENLGTPSIALVLIKNIALILLKILKNLDNFNRALKKITWFFIFWLLHQSLKN